MNKLVPNIKVIVLKQKKIDILKQPNLIDLDGDDDDTPPLLPLQIIPDCIPSSLPPLLPLQLDLSLPSDPEPDPTLGDISHIIYQFDNSWAEADIKRYKAI